MLGNVIFGKCLYFCNGDVTKRGLWVIFPYQMRFFVHLHGLASLSPDQYLYIKKIIKGRERKKKKISQGDFNGL